MVSFGLPLRFFGVTVGVMNEIILYHSNVILKPGKLESIA